MNKIPLFKILTVLLLPWQMMAMGSTSDSTVTTWAHCLCPEQTYTKNITREFQITPKGTTAIHNKHGNISVSTWSERKVKIEVSIAVSAGSQKEADRVLNNINVNFLATTAYVKAETMVQGMSLEGIENYTINYQVWIPTDNNLEISNKHGNCDVGNLNGSLHAQVKYGAFKAGKINADASFRADYCQSYFMSTNNLSGTVKYGTLLVDDAKNVQLDAEYNNATFRRCNEIQANTRFGTFEIGKADNVVLDTKFGSAKVLAVNSLALTSCHSRTEVRNLAGQIHASLQSGGLDIGALDKNFKRIEISAVNAVVDINCKNTDFCYQLSGVNTTCRMPSTAHPPNATTSQNYPTGQAANAGPVTKPGPPSKAITENGIFTKQGCLGATSAQAKVVANMTNGCLTIK
jgi:hypothetical protein